jgi:hypothetical protein
VHRRAAVRNAASAGRVERAPRGRDRGLELVGRCGADLDQCVARRGIHDRQTRAAAFGGGAVDVMHRGGDGRHGPARRHLDRHLDAIVIIL